MSQIPFFYKVKFHFLGRDEEKNLITSDWDRDFKNVDPLKARQEAFHEFDEYLEFLKKSKRIKLDSRGNYEIISPSGIPPKPEIPEDSEDLNERVYAFVDYAMEYHEDLEVLIVINDNNLMEEIGYGDSVFTIHTVASHGFNEQQVVDNLEMIEVELYKRCGIDINNHLQQVSHYGEDYDESGEEEEGALRTILPTPYRWQTKEEYFEKNQNDVNAETAEKKFPHLSLEKIIKDGESNTLEFKPSLAYNFDRKTSHWKPLFNNARTICGFLNCRGGLLLIGLSDSGSPSGIKDDLKLLGNKDKIRLKIDNLISNYFNNTVASLIQSKFLTYENEEILAIYVQPSKIPVFLKKYNPVADVSTKHFYVRRIASTTEIKDPEEIITYVTNHWYNGDI